VTLDGRRGASSDGARRLARLPYPAGRSNDGGAVNGLETAPRPRPHRCLEAKPMELVHRTVRAARRLRTRYLTALEWLRRNDYDPAGWWR
jgi:hypothetical protein